MRFDTRMRFTLPFLALATLGTVDAQAQALTLAQATTAVDAAEAEARRNGWNLTIVIAGADGIPILLRRMDDAAPRSYDIAMGKIRTALAAGMPTGDYGQALAAGRTDTIPNGITFEGGSFGRFAAFGAYKGEAQVAISAGLYSRLHFAVTVRRRMLSCLG